MSAVTTNKSHIPLTGSTWAHCMIHPGSVAPQDRTNAKVILAAAVVFSLITFGTGLILFTVLYIKHTNNVKKLDNSQVKSIQDNPVIPKELTPADEPKLTAEEIAKNERKAAKKIKSKKAREAKSAAKAKLQEEKTEAANTELKTFFKDDTLSIEGLKRAKVLELLPFAKNQETKKKFESMSNDLFKEMAPHLHEKHSALIPIEKLRILDYSTMTSATFKTLFNRNQKNLKTIITEQKLISTSNCVPKAIDFQQKFNTATKNA